MRFFLRHNWVRLVNHVKAKYRLNTFCSPMPISSDGDVSHRGAPSRICKPVIIVGTGRAGSTMLFNMLGAHPYLVPTRGFPDGEDTEMWVKVGGAFIAGFGSLKSKSPVGSCFCLPMDETDIEQSRCQSIHTYLVNKYSQLNDSQKRLLNKNPHLSNKVSFIHAIFPDVKLVHLIRHPLAVITSWKVILSQFHDIVIEIPDDLTGCMNIYPNQGWYNYTAHIGRINNNIYCSQNVESIRLLARYWLNININIVNQVERIESIDYHRISYESICVDQNAALSRLFNFCEVPEYAKCQIKARPDRNEKWKTSLTEQEVEMIRDELKGQSERFDYEL